MYTLSGIGKILIGKVVKNNPKHRTKVLSIGIILRALFILFIVILKENIATYFPIVAMLYGISEVFYWISHEVLFIDLTTNKNRKSYMSIKTILGKIIKINKYTKSAITYGVIESSMQTLVVIITIMTFKTSFNLGILTSIFSIFSMIAMYLYKKFYNKNNSKFILQSLKTLNKKVKLSELEKYLKNIMCRTGKITFFKNDT